MSVWLVLGLLVTLVAALTMLQWPLWFWYFLAGGFCGLSVARFHAGDVPSGCAWFFFNLVVFCYAEVRRRRRFPWRVDV